MRVVYIGAVYKKLIDASELPDASKAEALRDDFNLDGLPSIISEVRSRGRLNAGLACS